MAIGRVTQHMMSQQALDGMQTGISRLSRIQEQLSTGKVINRPSDDPSGASSAMRLRSTLADQKQYARNADDGLGWLNQTDTTLSSITLQVRRARELGLQGINGAISQQGRDALATEVDKLREGILGDANATYLGRPIFGGITAGDEAYVDDTTVAPPVATFAGVTGPVNRSVADGVKVRVDTEATAVFGAAGGDLFKHLTDLSAALRAGDTTAIGDAVQKLTGDADRVTTAQADVGTRAARIEKTRTTAEDAELTLTNALSEVENTDLPKATVDLQMQQVAYQAALAATARVMQPSLLDFLR